MVKANELRIGNYLLGASRREPVIVDWKLIKWIEEEGYGFLPIHLTQEILEKCGFKKWENGEFSERIDEYISLQIYEDGRYGFWSDSSENESNFTVISQDNRLQYLHQLQNLYHSLTGTELPVSF